MKLRDYLLLAALALAVLYAGVRAARAEPVTVLWRDPNVSEAVWGPRSDRVIEVWAMPQHFSWWIAIPPPSAPEAAGTASTIYSHALAMPDWPGCEIIVARIRHMPTGLRSSWSNAELSGEPCIDPPPIRIIPVPEPPVALMGYAAIVTLAWIRRRRITV